MSKVTQMEIWIRSTDVDSDGIVNNAHYFEFFEQARIKHNIALGLVIRPRAPGHHDRAITIAETTAKFKSPLQYLDSILVRCWTKEVRTRSFLLEYEIVLRETGKLIAQGSSAQVWLNNKGEPTPLPEDKRKRLIDSIVK
tara:strand:- start:241 stop:660 length:420 start_codon:yes stop_codon:yes gene_type:complete